MQNLYMSPEYSTVLAGEKCAKNCIRVLSGAQFLGKFVLNCHQNFFFLSDVWLLLCSHLPQSLGDGGGGLYFGYVLICLIR